MAVSSTPHEADRRIRKTRSHRDGPTVRTTYQLAAALGPKESQTVQETWTAAIKSIIGWVRGLCSNELPQEAWEGREFECGVPGNNVECATVPSEGLWSLRLTHQDAPYGEQQAVAGRMWTTDLALRQDTSGTHRFAVRVFCTSQPYCDTEITLTRPRIVRYLADSFTLSTGRQLESHAWCLNTENELDVFYRFITDPQRILPVYLLTEADANKLPGRVRQYVLDERRLAQRTLGLAHVAVLPHVASFGWTNRVGKVWSAFQGAARTYRPGLDFETDSPFAEHPLALAENMIFMRYKGLEGEEAFAAFLADRAHQESATRQVDWCGCLFFTDAKRLQAETTRREANEEADWQAIYQGEIGVLEQKIKETEEERDEMMDLADQADKDRDHYIAENNSLRWQVELLRGRLAEKTGEDPDTSIEIPQGYDDLPDWVSKNLASRLVLHPRAIRAVRNACYEDVELVYRSLLLLANEYRNMKLSYEGAKEAFDKQVDTLKVQCSPSISRERAGEEGDTYFLQYPSHSTNSRFLELHIRKGKGKNDHHCLAIYFFWDDETRQVVVGWLPSHLDNRLT